MNIRKIVATGPSARRLSAAVPQMNLGEMLDCEVADGGMWAIYYGAEIYCVRNKFWIVCFNDDVWRRCAAAFSSSLTEAV